MLLHLLVTICLWPQSVADKVPAEATAQVKEGNILFDQGKYDEAVKKYQAAVTLAPDWYEPHYELGQTFSQMKQPDEAKKEFALAIERDPKCWLCYQGLGNMADDLGDRDLALANYQKAVQLAPDRGQPRYNLAITYLRLKRVDETIAMLKECEQIEPGYASPYFLLGNLFYGQKKYYLAFDNSFRRQNSKKAALALTKRRN